MYLSFTIQDVDNVLVIENGVGNQARFSFASFQFVGQVNKYKIGISTNYMAHMLCDILSHLSEMARSQNYTF